ncbi:Toll/interleukin-1 receptor domain-containing protein [Tanacetum coccineum]
MPSSSNSSAAKKEKSSSNSSEPKIMVSNSTSSIQNSFKYDVFLSFTGPDTRTTFVDHLYQALKQKSIVTYKDDKKIKQGKMISDELIEAIEDSKFYIIIFSKNYASSSWCLEELVKIMECRKGFGHTVYPVFYDVEPTEVRKQSGSVGVAFSRHKKEKGIYAILNLFSKHKEDKAAGKWREALKEASDLAGWELKSTANGSVLRVKFLVESREYTKTSLSGLKELQKQVLSDVLNDSNITVSSVSDGKNMMRKFLRSRKRRASAACTRVKPDSKCHCYHEKQVPVPYYALGKEIAFEGMETRINDVVSSLETGVDDVRIIGIKGMGGSGKTTLVRAVYDHISVQFEGKSFVEKVREISKTSVSGLKELQKQVLSDVLNDNNIRVLVVLDDVDHIEQLEALTGERNWFKPGSTIIITTRDEQVLRAQGVNQIHGVNLLSDDEAMFMFRSYAFGKEIAFEGTVEKLEISYIGLEEDYKKIFLDVACTLKGERKDKAIRALESCGFRAIIGLKVLHQKCLITISDCGYIGMHDHIEEMGRNIVRRSHEDEPNGCSHLWIDEEIEEILADDMVRFEFISNVKTSMIM